MMANFPHPAFATPLAGYVCGACGHKTRLISEAAFRELYSPPSPPKQIREEIKWEVGNHGIKH